MKSLMIAAVLLFSASLLSIIAYMQPAQATTFPCFSPNPPDWCFEVPVPIDPWWDDDPCQCPDVIIPEDLRINEKIVIETIPGQFSDTLVISKVLTNGSAIAMPANATSTPIG